MELDKIAQIITTKDALIAYMIVGCVAIFETVVIMELAKRVGSLRKLFSMTALISKDRSRNTSNKRGKTANRI